MNQKFDVLYKYVGQWFFKRITVVGFQTVEVGPGQKRLILNLPNGGTLELPSYDKLILKLGNDFHEAVRKNMERESGQRIETNVEKR